MYENSAVVIEFLDDDIELIVMNDTEYLEVYDGSFGTPTAVPAEALPFTHAGNLVAGVGNTAYPITGGTFTILSVSARVATSPVGSDIILDINKNGTTIFANQAHRPTIVPGENAATVGTYSTSQVTEGDYITVDIDQVGSGSPGSDLVLVIRLLRVA